MYTKNLLLIGLVTFLFAGAMQAQESPGELSGVIDIHVHADPDSRPRIADVIEVAEQARFLGMRGLVFKNHYEATSAVAYLVRELVPELEVYGGIVLNRTVGGINAAAVEEMASVKGGWGKIVWLPTEDSEWAVGQEKRPFVRVTLNGRVTPEVEDVLAVIAKHKLTLATGHISPEESLLVIREARKLGIDRIIVTHPMAQRMTVEQMQEAAKMGAFDEFNYVQTIGKDHKVPVTMEEFATAIRAIRPEHCIMSTDLGSPGRPMTPAGFVAFIKALREKGFTQQDIDLMSKKNPARVLGLTY